MAANAYDGAGDYGSFQGGGGEDVGGGYGAGAAGDYTEQQGYAADQGGYGQNGAGGGGQSHVTNQVRSNQSDGSIINSRESPNSCKMFVGGVSKATTTGNIRDYH